MQTRLQQLFIIFLKGMAMGAADSVPGVSGGTIAFITNIYDELLASIKAINPTTLMILFRQGPRAAWQAVNGRFLFTLGLGILSALLISANGVVWLLANHYTYLMCFFSGLILASVWFVGSQIQDWKALQVGMLLLGLLFSIALALLPAVTGMDNLLYYFMCGAVAICAMLLPGISGAFILLLLGAYGPVLLALKSLHWPVILVFASGCLAGLLSFSRFLHWLLNNHRSTTLAGLLGVLAGSLGLLWPWRLQVGTGAEFKYALPGAFDAVSGQGISLLLALLLVLGGIILVWGLDQLGRKSRAKSNSSATPQ